MERLTEQHAGDLGLSTESITYELLSEIAADDPKVVRDAGNLAVTRV